MRLVWTIGAALFLTLAAAAASRADGPANPAPEAAAKPRCHCPPVHHAQHPHRHIRHYVRREWVPAPVVLAAPAIYEPGIPSPWNPGYDRGMVLHFRSPDVSGIYYAEPGLPPTPPVAPVQPYRLADGPTVLQYDGLTGEYIQLSEFDAQRLAPAVMPLR